VVAEVRERTVKSLVNRKRLAPYSHCELKLIVGESLQGFKQDPPPLIPL
jgi:hypothetical protein